jgi:hypothetical protein
MREYKKSHFRDPLLSCLYLLGLEDEGSGHNIDLILLQVHVLVRHFDQLHQPLSVVDCPNLGTQDLVAIE